MERKIEVERTLIIGDSKVSVGTECYVKFLLSAIAQRGRWMYAKCVAIFDTCVVFKKGDYAEVWLRPSEIISITDSPNLTKEEMLRLQKGEIIICKIEEGEYEL